MSTNFDQYLYKPGQAPPAEPPAAAPSPAPRAPSPLPTPVQPSPSNNSFPNNLESAILNAARPLDIPRNDEIVRVNGEVGYLANKPELDSWRGEIPIHQYPINDDPEPEIIRKRTDQVLIYEQEVAIRYLRPPTPPPPGEIILKEEKNIPTPPAPPLVIRQQPPRPETPPPVVIREAPPRAPPVVPPKVVTIPGKRLAPPPRKVVVERLPQLPTKPQAVIIERWLPYAQPKRKVVFSRNTVPDPVIPKPKNVIVQWETPQVYVKKDYKDLGVLRANPIDYVNRYADVLKDSSELPSIAKEVRPPSGVILAAEYSPPTVYELEGDVEALRLIDLDNEGLSVYKNLISNAMEEIKRQPNLDLAFIFGLLAQAFAAADLNEDGRLDRSEALNLLAGIYNSIGVDQSQSSINSFIDEFDRNHDGFIDFEEFKKGAIKKFLNRAHSNANAQFNRSSSTINRSSAQLAQSSAQLAQSNAQLNKSNANLNTSNVNLAQSNANLNQSNARLASTANLAQSNANLAQSNARLASTANLAQSNANLAQSNARLASTANLAQSNANLAQSNANLAQSNVNLAPSNANLAQSNARLASTANLAQSNANLAQSNANLAPSNANLAQSNANLNQSNANLNQSNANLNQSRRNSAANVILSRRGSTADDNRDVFEPPVNSSRNPSVSQ